MTLRSFTSFDDLRDELTAPATPGAAATEVLRVEADVRAPDSAAAARTCRTMALDWIASRFPDPLPPEGSRFETFTRQSGSHAVEAARVRTDGDDVWAARLVHSSGSEEAWVTEVGVRVQSGRVPEFRLRLLRERRSSGLDDAPRVPDLLTRLASVLDLRRDGKKITTDPWLVDSEPAAHRLCQELASPERRIPWLVLSVPEGADDPNRPLLDPVAMARATAGLAVVVVLRSDFTWTLTRTFDKQRSVYLGAVRLYLPGFSSTADPRDHRLILFDWMTKPGGLVTHRDELLRRIAEHSLTGSGAWSFAQIRNLVSQTGAAPEPARSGPAGTRSAAPPEPTRPGPADTRSVAPAADPAPPPQREAPPPARPAPREVTPSEPETGPADEAAEPSRVSPGMWSLLRSRGAGVWRALVGAPDPEAEQAVEALRRELDASERRLGRSEERRRKQAAQATERLATARSDRREYEQEWERAEHRADEAVRARDLAVAEVQRLRSEVIALGGAHSVPHRLPTDWSGFAAWCEAELTGRVRLLPRARRELKRARFAEVELAARCLRWLGGEYRRLRLETSGQGLKAIVENGVHNQPCGGDAFTIKWRGRGRRVDWHIKSGGSPPEPTPCPRIYYFWDSSSSEVVVASMPAHIRNDST